MPLRVIKQNVPRIMQIYGMKLQYRESQICSCVGSNNGVPRAGHTCEGGYLYKDPVDFYGIKQQRQSKYDRTAGGMIPDSYAQFTIPRFHLGIEQPIWSTLTHGDVISIPSKPVVKMEILQRGVRDKIYDFDLKGIIRLSKEALDLTEGADFTVNYTTRVISFPDEDIIKPGDYYAVKYYTTQQYIIFDDEPFDRGGDGEDLPRRVRAVIRRYQNPDNNPIDNIDTAQDVWSTV